MAAPGSVATFPDSIRGPDGATLVQEAADEQEDGDPKASNAPPVNIVGGVAAAVVDVARHALTRD